MQKHSRMEIRNCALWHARENTISIDDINVISKQKDIVTSDVI
jgi:hypothetical protein